MMRDLFLLSIGLITVFCFPGCGDKTAPAPPPPPVEVSASHPKIVAFGDSLTAGLGLASGETYPAQLQELLRKSGYHYEVVNSGVSGETSAGGLRRIEWALDGDVRFLILELGANDILRGQPMAEMKENLSRIILRARESGAVVILAGMEAPTNLGPDYRREVHEAYRDLAETHQLPFIPFFLKGVAGSETLNQEDLSHPNPEGARILAQNVFEVLKPLLENKGGGTGKEPE